METYYFTSLLKSQDYVTVGICGVIRPLGKSLQSSVVSFQTYFVMVSSVNSVGFAFGVVLIIQLVMKSFSVFHCLPK